MRFNKVEDIKVWKMSIELVKEIYFLCRNNHNLSRDFSLKDQIQRASVSIPSNIAEGFERESDKEFMRYLYIAKGSCAEVRTQLFIICEIGWISNDEYVLSNNKCLEISRMLMGLIKKIRLS